MQTNQCVVIIPAYEPSNNFVDYAKTLINARIAQLIVVNDGSGEKYSDVFNKLRELERCTVLEYAENHGKGYALKTAFKYAKENFDERFVFTTADCDGQHLVEDVLNTSLTCAEFGDSFVLGVRDFSLPQVPKRSRVGNVSTRRVFKLLYGVRISDTQTGLRSFPYSLLDTLLEIKGDRFEYEMNQLVVLHKRDVPIREVPITTVYEEKPDDVEKVSHYHTVRDSLRVAKVLLTNLSFFMIASVLSAVCEILFLYLGLKYLPEAGLWIFSQAICAQTIARVGSSVFNFAVNYKYVFNGKSKRSIYRYYILWLFLYLASLGYASLFAHFIEQPSLVTLCTGLSTAVMSILSYQIQTRWVFAGRRRKNGKFWGWYSRFVRFFYRLFTKKYTSLVAEDKVGTVYVCRHLNMHGPLTTITKLGFDVHLLAFSPFFSYRECYKQFSTYTFPVTQKMGKFKSKFCAFWTTGALVPILKSMEAVPVYRKNTNSLTTLKKSMECLEKHENIIIFPDINYTANSQTESDIYSGFLLLEKLYYKKFNRHLKFVPLVIDDESKTIVEKTPIRFRNGDFKSQMDEVKDKIMVAIGCKLGEQE